MFGAGVRVGADPAVADGGGVVVGGFRSGFGYGVAGLVSPAGSPIGFGHVGRVIVVTVRRDGVAGGAAGRIAVGMPIAVGKIIGVVRGLA